MEHRSDKLILIETFKHDLSLIEKQVRMLGELAENAKVLHEEPKPDETQGLTDFIIVDQRRTREIVELMRSEVGHLRFGIEALLGERQTPLLDQMIKNL